METKFLNNKWFNMNKAIVFEKITSCVNIIELKNMKAKWKKLCKVLRRRERKHCK
jgi:hypothetical protein